MSRKKVIILLLLICIIAIAASVLFAINKRHTDWVVNAYTAALENAKVAVEEPKEDQGVPDPRFDAMDS